MEQNGRNIYPMKRVKKSFEEKKRVESNFLFQAVVDELKRFDQISREPEIADRTNPTGDQNSNHHDPTLDETKKNLGFQWSQTKK